MDYKKLFFPIGGGDELKERIHGALLITDYFNAHLEVFKAQAKPSDMISIDVNIPQSVLKDLNTAAKEKLDEDLLMHETIFQEQMNKVGIKHSSQIQDGVATAEITTGEGYRSKLIDQASKFCDLVIVAAPHEGRLTATFETTVTKSGKPALMFPRKMKSFKIDKILIGWNNSPEVARAITEAIPLLQKAKEVHIITSKEFTPDSSIMTKLQSYLEIHDVKSDYKIVETTKIPGEALLDYARRGQFDIIVAGAFGHRGLKELMLGGTTKYILEHSDIPIFMAH